MLLNDRCIADNAQYKLIGVKLNGHCFTLAAIAATLESKKSIGEGAVEQIKLLQVRKTYLTARLSTLVERIA